MPTDPFILRWTNSGAAERANCQTFLSELCDFLQVPRPDPTTSDNRANQYVFERAITEHLPNGATRPGFIDLYKRGAFLLEAKQGASATKDSAPLLFASPRRVGIGLRDTPGWDESMMRAHAQAERYAKSLPKKTLRRLF